MTTGSVWARVGAWMYEPFLALGERRGMAARRRELLASAGACAPWTSPAGAGAGCRRS